MSKSRLDILLVVEPITLVSSTKLCLVNKAKTKLPNPKDTVEKTSFFMSVIKDSKEIVKCTSY